MATTPGCPQPTDCSPCARSCDEAPPAPVMPRCDIALPDGVFTNATVVVEGGCIIEVQPGLPFLYQPDDCCATPGGGGGDGGTGPAGPPGPAGQPATIQVGTVATTPPGTPATVTNTGTAQNAVFNFTIPRGEPGEDGETPTGLTINTAGIVFEDGSLKAVPVQWPPVLMAVAQPVDVPGATLVILKDSDTGILTFSLSMESYDAALRGWVDAQIATATDALQAQIDTLQAAITDLQNRVAVIESTCCGP